MYMIKLENFGKRRKKLFIADRGWHPFTCPQLQSLQLLNDGQMSEWCLLQANDGQMLVNYGQMSVWYTNFTIINEYFTIIDEHFTIITLM